MTTTPIPSSLATACAAHDRHRLDVLDALLDEAAPSAVRELLATALDLCATLRADRDALRTDLASERAHLAACRTRIAGLEQAADERSKEVARLSEEERSAGWATVKAENQRAISAEAEVARLTARIAGLEQAADERSREDKGRGARMDEIRAALGAPPFASDGHIADRIRALTARVAELEARPVLTREALQLAITSKRTTREGPQIGTDATIFAQLTEGGPVTLPAQDAATALAKALMAACGFDAPELMKDEEVMAMRIYQALASLGASPTSPTVAPQPAEVFAGVSIDELCSVYSAAYGERPGHRDDRRPDAIRAVLARLEVSLVAPVDPEAVARDYANNEVGK